jgi:hypothetical protein
MRGAMTSALVATLIVVIANAAVWPGAAMSRALRIQNDDAETVEVASGPLREPTLQLVGRNTTSQNAITFVGYLKGVANLDPPDLFAADDHTVGTARFTYVADVTISASSNRADTTTTDGSGVLRIYFAEDGGASWDNPLSFAAGQQVAEYTLDLRETLQRQAPGVGVAVGDGQLVQRAAETFQIGDESFTFGLVDIAQRLRYVGAPLPNAGGGSATAIMLTGTVSVTQREAIYAQVGDPSIVATPAAEANDCAALQPWLAQAQDALTQARDAGSVTDANAAIETIDVAATRQAADAVAALAESQRSIDVPSGAAEANQLVVTALSSYARGLRAVADAAEARDAELLELGQITLQDGQSLIDRAAERIAALSVDCASGERSGS